MRNAQKRRGRHNNVKNKIQAMSVTTLFVSMSIMMTGCGRGGGSGGDSSAPGTKAADTSDSSGGLGSISFYVDGKHYSTEDYFATYDPSDNRTGFIGGPDGEGGWNLGFDFEGSGAGTYKARATMRLDTFRAFNTEDFTVTITSFGDIREFVEGTFSGTLASIADPDNTITITEGRFTAWRTPF